MKILMLGWELPPYNDGGLGVACFNIASALSRRGAEIDFVLPDSLAQHNDIKFMSVSPVVTAKSYTGVTPSPYDNQQIDRIRQIQKKYIRHAAQKAVSSSPDVIHAHDWLTLEAGLSASRHSGAPLIAHIHATEYDRAGGKSGNPLIHEIEQTGLMLADSIVAVSQRTKDMIVDKYDIPEHKVTVIHNSILPDQITAADEADEYAYLRSMQAQGYTVVSAIGRLTIQKGLTHFLEAAAEACYMYEKFLFVIAGDGEQRRQLIELSADYGIADKVLFTGYVNGPAWRQLYELTDVFVMSSVSEPFGLTALEAASSRTALVLTKQSGVTEVLKNVLSYDYWDTSRLADRLINLATSPGLRHELQSAAFDESRTMSWDHVAERFMAMYRHHAGAAV